MKITTEWLEEKRACKARLTWFDEHFPKGEADYQAVLDALAEENRLDYATWLFDAAGPLDTVMEIDGDLEVEGSFFFAGAVKITGTLKAGFSIRLGRGISAGCGISAGRGISAGWGISAGDSISAGFFVTCKFVLKFTLRIFAGTCYWKMPTDEEKTITCGKFVGGELAYGILNETGIPAKTEVEA